MICALVHWPRRVTYLPIHKLWCGSCLGKPSHLWVSMRQSASFTNSFQILFKDHFQAIILQYWPVYIQRNVYTKRAPKQMTQSGKVPTSLTKPKPVYEVQNSLLMLRKMHSDQKNAIVFEECRPVTDRDGYTSSVHFGTSPQSKAYATCHCNESLFYAHT